MQNSSNFWLKLILQKPEVISQTISHKDADLNENQIIASFQKINRVWDELFVAEQARIMHLLIRDVVIKPERGGEGQA